jgi:hypothetical protein
LYQGEDFTSVYNARRRAYRRYSIGFVFQFYNRIKRLTARENMLLAKELVPHPLAAAEALDMVKALSPIGPFSGTAIRRRTAARRGGVGAHLALENLIAPVSDMLEDQELFSPPPHPDAAVRD